MSKRIIVIDENVKNPIVEEAIGTIIKNGGKELDRDPESLEGSFSETFNFFLEDEIKVRIHSFFKYRDDYNIEKENEYIEEVINVLDIDQYLDSSLIDEVIGDVIDYVNSNSEK